MTDCSSWSSTASSSSAAEEYFLFSAPPAGSNQCCASGSSCSFTLPFAWGARQELSASCNRPPPDLRRRTRVRDDFPTFRADNGGDSLTFRADTGRDSRTFRADDSDQISKQCDFSVILPLCGSPRYLSPAVPSTCLCSKGLLLQKIAPCPPLPRAILPAFRSLNLCSLCHNVLEPGF